MTTTPSEPVNLLPCPFCGDTNTPFFANVVLRDMDFIYCPACRCRGPHRKTETEAIAAWNTRTRPTLPADAVEAAALRICEERCAQMGEPPCCDVTPDEPTCDECIGCARAALSAALPRDLQGLGHKESCELLGVPLHLASCACARDPQGLVEALRHCGEQHLHRYLAEFEFRYNNREALGCNDQDRARSALQGATGKRLTYAKWTGQAQ